jgi:glycosyltransferase involved in cell wall biosynthesis
LRIAINTSGTIVGGAITHLRNILPRMLELLEDDELLVVANDPTAAQIGLDPSRVELLRTDVRFENQLRRLVWENTALPPLLRHRGVDVVLHPTNIPLYRCPVPHVNLMHNVAPFLPEIIAEESTYQKIRLSVLRALTTSAFRHAERTIFISEWGKRCALRNERPGLDPGPVIPFGADHLKSPSDPDVLSRWGLTPGRYVLSVSHFYRYKRIEHLVRAFIELGTRAADFPLVLVGAHFDAPYTEEIRRLAEAAPGPVLFTGALDAGSVYALLEACAVFVFTSEVENMPIALLEAMREGAPIVTTRKCSMPEVCGEAAVYVDSLDATGYARALAPLLESEDLRRACAERSRARSRDFRWSEAASRTLALLREVAGAAGKAARPATNAAGP